MSIAQYLYQNESKLESFMAGVTLAQCYDLSGLVMYFWRFYCSCDIIQCCFIFAWFSCKHFVLFFSSHLFAKKKKGILFFQWKVLVIQKQKWVVKFGFFFLFSIYFVRLTFLFLWHLFMGHFSSTARMPLDTLWTHTSKMQQIGDAAMIRICYS